MSGGKLIFAFKDGLNLALSEDELARGATIKFGSGFEHLALQYDSSILTLVGQEEVRDRGPTVEFAIKTLPTDVEDLQPVQPGVPEVAVQRFTVPEPSVVASGGDQPLDLPAVFHPGTTEDLRIKPTKSQRRNYIRKEKRNYDRLEREAELRSLTAAPEVAGYTPTDVIPVVEEYVPQYVEREPPRQIISETELEEFQNVVRQNFEYFQQIKGKYVNIVEGLELHAGIFSEYDQRSILRTVYDFQDRGRAGLLRPRTYSEPRKWMRGKGRVTIQFGCCYNYATDSEGNPPGIIRHEDVDPIPPALLSMIKKMVAWHVLQPESTPDSCIVNIYEEGDCIPPHIDSHDFARPFCTASFLSQCEIVFGTELKIRAPGEFSGPVRIPLPVGSVLVFEGNGADLAKHCIPAVPRRRISITFRRMKFKKLPYNHRPEPELQGLRPLTF